MTTATAVLQQRFCGARLIPIVCNVLDVCPLPAVCLRPRDLEPKHSPNPLSTDSERWSLGVGTAPLCESTYRLQFNPFAHSTQKIRCGAFVPAKCSPFVRWGFTHAQLLWQARTLPRPDWRCWSPVVGICEKPDPIEYKPLEYPTLKEEEEAVKHWLATAPADLLTSGEIRGLKYEAPVKGIKKKANPWSIEKSWSRVKEHSDDEDGSNNGVLSDHIIDATRKTTEPSATKLLDHSDLQAIRKYEKVEVSSFPIQIFFRNKPIAEAAGEMSITENALQKRVVNYFEEAHMYDEISKGGIAYHLIKKQLNEEQMIAVRDGKAVFILLQLNGEWVWRQLDVDTYGTVWAAIEAFRVEAELNALARKPGWKKSNDSKELQTEAIKEVKARYDGIFRKAFVMSNRPAWRGILGQLTP